MVREARYAMRTEQTPINTNQNKEDKIQVERAQGAHTEETCSKHHMREEKKWL